MNTLSLIRPARCRRSLPWPASKIERDVLHELWVEAKATGMPITAIVKQAIEEHLNRRLDAPAAPSPISTAA